MSYPSDRTSFIISRIDEETEFIRNLTSLFWD